jgi:hypothetical protein
LPKAINRVTTESSERPSFESNTVISRKDTLQKAIVQSQADANKFLEQFAIPEEDLNVSHTSFDYK